MQEAFFARRHITGTTRHVVKNGDSLWELSEVRYKVPVWLLRQYNPDLDLAQPVGFKCPVGQKPNAL